jgi:hypothetical protein
MCAPRWQETVEVVDVHGSNLSSTMVAQLATPERGPDRAKTYAIATTTYVASEVQAQLGRIEGRRRGSMLRDLTVADLKQHGFSHFR